MEVVWGTVRHISALWFTQLLNYQPVQQVFNVPRKQTLLFLLNLERKESLMKVYPLDPNFSFLYCFWSNGKKKSG